MSSVPQPNKVMARSDGEFKTGPVIIEIRLGSEEIARVKDFLIQNGASSKIAVLKDARLEVKVQVEPEEGKK
jgi:hypothetical protein